MRFMNDHDIARALETHRNHPVLHQATRMLAAVAHDADCNSDGWHSWPKPCQASRKLIELIENGRALTMAGKAPTEADYRAALAPIKAFYTRAHRGDYGGSYPAMPVLS